MMPAGFNVESCPGLGTFISGPSVFATELHHRLETSLGGGDKIAREMTLWELKGRHEFLTGKCNKEVCLNYILKE